MRVLIAISIAAAATPAAAQSLSFEAGKQLTIPASNWAYVQTATGGEARYGAYFTIRCNRSARSVTLIRTGVAGALTLVTSEAVRELSPGNTLAATDALLDAMAFSRGRFLVSAPGIAPLAIPAWPEAAKAVEDCRI